jgi:hypothetical protein
MLHATKATVKRLENIIKTNTKNYDNEKEHFCRLFLDWIKKAENYSKEYELFKLYDPEGLKNLSNPSVFYSAEGLYIDNSYDLYTPEFYQLEYRYPELIHFMHCLDLQNCTIKDINKLVKLIIEAA